MRALPIIETDSLDRGVDIADKQKRDVKPGGIKMGLFPCKVEHGHCADESGKSNPSFLTDKDLRNGKEKAGPGQDQGGRHGPLGKAHEFGKEIVKSGSGKVDKNGNPAQHPQASTFLTVAQVDPGKERYQ